VFTVAQAVAWVRASAAVVEENAAELTRLDAAIGDGDHGTNMNRGFKAALQRLEGLQDEDLGSVFKAVGMALISKVGGASGPLYGSFYLALGKELGDAAEVDDERLAAALRAGYQGVVARGKAQLEDKTMLDALLPAVDAMRAALEAGNGLTEILERGAAAAEAGMQATKTMQARKGRGSYLGERSVGHVDPGAVAAHLMLKGAADVWRS